MAKPGDQMAGGTGGCGRLLASHADREQVIDTLKAAFVQGLLTKDEFDLRVGQTLGSRIYAELAAVTADIPGGLIGAQLPPKRAQAKARAAGNTAVKSGVCTLTAIILAASTSAAAVSGPGAALIMALFLLGIGGIIAVIVALLVAGIRLLESRHGKRSSGQLSPRSSPGAGAQASRRPASGGPAGQFPQVGHGQHTAEAARSDLAGLQSSGSRPPRQWRSRGLPAIGRPIAVQLAWVISGQPRLLRVSEVGCSAASSAVIRPIPKPIVRVRFSSPAPPRRRKLASRCWPPALGREGRDRPTAPRCRRAHARRGRRRDFRRGSATRPRRRRSCPGACPGPR
jgi:DUF1707 SHOCT-like domain